MKTGINTNRVVNVSIVFIVAVFTINFYFLVNHHPNLFNVFYSDYKTYTLTNQLRPVDPPVSDHTPYSEYQTLKAKVRTTRDLKNGDWLHSGGVQLGQIIGRDGAQLCDTCTVNHDKVDIPGVHQSYIKLPGWKLKAAKLDFIISDSVIFHVEHGQSYIRKVVIDKIYKKPHNNTHYSVHLADIPVGFKYSGMQDCLLIPVDASVKNICSYIFGGLAVLFVGYIFYLIAAFCKLIIDISKGLSFTTDNIVRLRLIALSLLSYPVVSILLNLLVRLAFNSYFTVDVVMNSAAMNNWWIMMGLGIIFLLLFKAFRQGKMFKEELELTV